MGELVMKYIKSITLSIIVIAFLLASTLSPLQVNAATAVDITVEPGNGTIATGTNADFRLYATVSGGNLFAVGFRVNLSGMTYNSYNASGSAFNGTSAVTSGDSVGSVTFEVVASDAAPSKGASGKRYIGSFNAKSGAVGSASVAFANLEAYDENVVAIPVTSSAATYSIIATAATPTPSQPYTPTTSSTPPANNHAPSTTIPASQPNATKILVPDASGNKTIITTPDKVIAAGSIDPNAPAAKKVATITLPIVISKKIKTYTAIAGAVVSILLLFGLVYSFSHRKKIAYSGMTGFGPVTGTTKSRPPVTSTRPQSTITAPPVSKEPTAVEVLGSKESRKLLGK